MHSKNYFILLLFFIILKSVAVWSSNLEKIKSVELDIYLNNIEFYDFNKNTIKVVEKEIDFYILNFWASWCAPCIKEMKSFNELKKKNPKIKVITLSQDADIEEAVDFFRKNNYNNIEKAYDYGKNISRNFFLRGLPTTFVFNDKFEAIAKVEGIIEWHSEDFKKWLEKTK